MAFHWNGQEAGRGKRAPRQACYNTSHGPAGMLHRVHRGKYGLPHAGRGSTAAHAGRPGLCRYSCWGQDHQQNGPPWYRSNSSPHSNTYSYSGTRRPAPRSRSCGLDPRNVQAYVDGTSAELTPRSSALTRSRSTRAACSPATSCCSGSGPGGRPTVTAPSTSSSASYARRSTPGRRGTRSSRRATASATSSIPRRSSPSAAGVEDPASEPRGTRSDEAGLWETTVSSVTAGILIVSTSRPACSSAARLRLRLLGRVGHVHLSRGFGPIDTFSETASPRCNSYRAAATDRSPGRAARSTART